MVMRSRRVRPIPLSARRINSELVRREIGFRYGHILQTLGAMQLAQTLRSRPGSCTTYRGGEYGKQHVDGSAKDEKTLPTDCS
eukprot:CAMPEP_0206061772 /NCGR_PEP_ID=MMETSP1466-20131121/55091_1 /ASSEMBLY_ACC=CAM_ASM_001126 /TAXON_ID=44452 /ORGANISM="Pavlova gyrans, Strain CCMP608" /LENGTH=82 /DNA_ID=CAMNT_0053437127 /DNA_START=81 /DNA_END=326 /DNA_ORIENTATION=+